MKKILIFCSSFLLASTVPALTQNDFVERLVQTHPFFKQLNFDADYQNAKTYASTANQDWVLGVDTNFKREDVSNISSITTYTDLDTTSVDVSASKNLVNSGADIVVKHNWKEKSKASTATLNTNRNKFSVDYVYPLLKDSAGINDLLANDLANIEAQISTLELAENKENFILEQLSKFIDLAYAQQQLLINQKRLELAKKELDLTQAKFAQSVVDEVDVLLQKDAYQRANQSLLQSQSDLALLRHEIATTLDLDVAQIKANFDLYKPYQMISADLKEYLKNNSRVLKKNALEQALIKRQLKSDKNSNQAELDLKIGFASEGEDANYSNSIDNQSNAWNIGLGLSYPLGATQSKATVSKTQIKLNKAKESAQQELLNIYSKARVLKEKLHHLNQILKSNQAQIEIAKARTLAEKNRYNNGNSEISFVISAQNNEQNIELNYAQVAKNYQKSVLDFLATLDQL